MSQASSPLTPRGGQTRGRILRSAERWFADRGFAATRLEDVAADAEVQRPSLLYHYPSKRTLYDAVLRDIADSAMERIAALTRGDAPAEAMLERCVSSWVDFVWERPAVARILLREGAEQGAGRSELMAQLSQPFIDLLKTAIEEGRASGAFAPIAAEPLQIAIAIVGASIFFVGALPGLAGPLPFDPLSERQREEHRRVALGVARRLLGVDRAGRG